MDGQLANLSDVIARTDERLRRGADGEGRVWHTGFGILDPAMGGGLRSGGLHLVAGPQGVGKTMFCLQLARNIVHAGRSAIYFSFEHNPEDLFERLVAMEAGLLHDVDAASHEKIRVVLEDLRSSLSLEERLGDLTGGVEALQAVREYAPRLNIHRSSGATTDLASIRAAVHAVIEDTGEEPFVVVDYLQKVAAGGARVNEHDRTTMIAEGLKDFAMEAAVPIVAVVASDHAGLETGARMRVHHLRGSTALGYEADVVMIMENKFDVVARHHLVYNLGNADRFREWVVLSLEKNRSGVGGVSLEYRKRFEQSRFDIDGQVVSEQLVDDRVFTE